MGRGNAIASSSRRTRGFAALGAAIGLVAAATGCSGGGGDDDTAPSVTFGVSSTRGFGVGTGTGPDSVTSTTEATKGADGPVVLKVLGGIDLDDGPALVLDQSRIEDRIVSWPSLGEPAEVSVEISDDVTSEVRFSPDRSLVAIATDGDAVRKARMELLDAVTGKQVGVADLDAARATPSEWSPDSTAVLAQGLSTNGARSYTVVRDDKSSEPLDIEALQSQGWVTGAEGATVPAVVEESPRVVQTVSTDGDLVAVLAHGAGGPMANGVLTETGVEPFTGVAAEAGNAAFGNGYNGGSGACPRFAYLIVNSGGPDAKHLLFDADTKRVTELDKAPAYGAVCAVPSPDGDHVALSFADGVAVVDLGSGKATAIAREGRPIAWSKDSKKVLVSGNGTFVVAADGSGGSESKVAVDEACVIPEKGIVVTEGPQGSGKPSGLVSLDVGTGRSQNLGQGQLGKTCEVSKDGRWLLSGTALADLEDGASGIVQLQRPDGQGTAGVLHLPGTSAHSVVWKAR